MAKTVGLSRKIKLQWLNKAVDLLNEQLSENEYKKRMNEYLSFEIESPTVLRKTREILMRIWFYEDDKRVTSIRKDAYDLIKKYPDYDVAIHWCMLLMIYPVFADLSKLIGRISDLNGVVVLKQLKQKLYDEWGERTTLLHSTDKIIATLKELGVISTDKPGHYSIIKHEINNPEIAGFLIRVAMIADGNSYYSFDNVNDFDVLYPFEYKLSREEMMSDKNLCITQFNNELVLAVN